MALTDAELVLHRLGTKHFIDANPTDIDLIPVVETDVAGTLKYAEQPPRPTQRFKVIWAYDNGVYRQLGDEGGVRRFDFIIVGEYDAEVAIGDFWKVGVQEFRVEYIFPSNEYEVKAGGISHGPVPG